MFLEESVKDGCEGLMVKMLATESSTYEPSRRSMNWLKVSHAMLGVGDDAYVRHQLKKDYLSGVGDSLDLVVVGAYHGKGKRTAVYGAFLLACYDPDSENFQTICKIGTGFSEEILAQFYETLKPLELEGGARGNIEVGAAKPDVWFEPKIVWEVLTADLSLSPVYTAAHGLVSPRQPVDLLTLHRPMSEAFRCGSRGLSKSAMTRTRRRLRRRSKLLSSTSGKLRQTRRAAGEVAGRMMDFGETMWQLSSAWMDDTLMHSPPCTRGGCCPIPSVDDGTGRTLLLCPQRPVLNSAHIQSISRLP